MAALTVIASTEAWTPPRDIIPKRPKERCHYGPRSRQLMAALQRIVLASTLATRISWRSSKQPSHCLREVRPGLTRFFVLVLKNPSFFSSSFFSSSSSKTLRTRVFFRPRPQKPFDWGLVYRPLFPCLLRSLNPIHADRLSLPPQWYTGQFGNTPTLGRHFIPYETRRCFIPCAPPKGVSSASFVSMSDPPLFHSSGFRTHPYTPSPWPCRHSPNLRRKSAVVRTSIRAELRVGA